MRLAIPKYFKYHLMKQLIVILTAIVCTACSNKKAEQAKDLISRSEAILIYKYDSINKAFLLFNLPSNDSINNLKQILNFDDSYKTVKPISPTYRVDLLTKENVQGEIFIAQSATPYLTFKSSALEVSSPLDVDLSQYLKKVQQNVFTSKDSVSLTFRLKGDFDNMQCRFYKTSNSTPYSEFSVGQYYQAENTKKHDLTSIMNYMAIFWMATKRDAPIHLQKVYVGDPYTYNDVTKRHIEAFKHSTKWTNYLKQRGSTIDYQLIADIMLESDVYKPLNDFLKLKGFEIVEINLEKVGLIPSKRLEDDGLNSNIIIPTPHMVWIKIDKTNCKK